MIHGAIDDIHREVRDRSDEQRERKVALHNRRSGVTPAKFTVGEFVLVRTAAPHLHKLKFKWRGIHRVKRSVSDIVFEVESILSRKRQTDYTIRLRLYRTPDEDTTVRLELTQVAEHLGTN